MTGFWVLVQKELLEQRRTKKFLALALVFTFLAVVPPTIFRTVVHFQEGAHGVEQAREALENIIGGMMPVFGTGVVIIIAMGALANERASGTAAMTLSKPVARSAFVAAKLLALGASIFGAVAVGGAVVYILTLILFADGGVGRFALGLLITSTYLWYVGAITLLICPVLPTVARWGHRTGPVYGPAVPPAHSTHRAGRSSLPWERLASCSAAF